MSHDASEGQKFIPFYFGITSK